MATIDVEDVPTIIALVTLGAVGWESLLAWSFDWHLICEWRKKRIGWLSVLQYFFCKGSMLCFITFSVVIRLVQSDKVNCWILINAANLSGGFAIWSASSIFALRAIALEGGWKRPLSILLALLWMSEGCFLFIRYRRPHEIYPPSLEEIGCHQRPVSEVYATWMFALLCVDVIAVCIMLRALFGKVGKPVIQGGLGRILILDGLLYTMTTGILAISAGITTVARGKDPGPNYISLFVSIFLTSMMGAVIATRSFRRLFKARERSRAPHDFFDLNRLPPTPVESPRVVFWRRGSDQSGQTLSPFGRRGSDKSTAWPNSASPLAAAATGGLRRSSAPTFTPTLSPINTRCEAGSASPADVEMALDTSAVGRTTALGGLAAGMPSPLSRDFETSVPLLQVPDVAALRHYDHL